MTLARDTVLRELARVAARLRLQQAMREGAWGIVALSVIVAVHEVLRHEAGDAAILVAARPLLAFLAIAVAAVLVLRAARLPPAQIAAAAIDRQAELPDVFLSAAWFARESQQSGFIELHLANAADQTAALDLRRLFPLRIPRVTVALTAGAALVAVAPALWPDRVSDSAVVASVAAPRTSSGVHSEAERAGTEVADGAGESAGGSGDRPRDGLWQEVEALAREFAGRPESQSLAEAVAARDARRAAQALRVASQASAGAGAAQRSDGPGDQMNETVAKDILSRLESLLAQDPANTPRRPPDSSAESEAGTARLDRALREDDDGAEPAARRDATPGEDALNTSLRALSRSSTAGRDAVHGEADSTEGAGRANVSGGALGRRISATTAGSGEGDQATPNIASPQSDDNVLGARTQRLAVRLKSVDVTQQEAGRSPGDDDPTGTEEAFYAATRAQASQSRMTAPAGVSRATAEDVVAREVSPLAYREAVKRYTLTRHRREPPAAVDPAAHR